MSIKAKKGMIYTTSDGKEFYGTRAKAKAAAHQRNLDAREASELLDREVLKILGFPHDMDNIYIYEIIDEIEQSEGSNSAKLKALKKFADEFEEGRNAAKDWIDIDEIDDIICPIIGLYIAFPEKADKIIKAVKSKILPLR